jgi:membrane protein implicated in regulation of membrane protease activity
VDPWVLWIVAAVAFAVAEIASVSFYLASFAAGALVAAGLDLAGLSVGAQIAAFLISSVALLTLVRPIARRHLSAPPALRTGVAALIGREAIVLERIANDEGVGCVRLDGEVWTARAYDADDIIEAGRRVQVLEIRGATALVSE